MERHKTRLLLAGVLCLALLPPTTNAQDTKWEKSTAAGMEAYQQGRYTEAEKLLLVALSEAEKFGPNDPRVAKSLKKLGDVYHAQHRYSEAAQLYERSEAIRKRRKELAWARERAWLRYTEAGRNAHREGRYAEAEEQFKAAVKEAETFGEQDPRYATSLNSLALLYLTQGNYAQAEPLLQRSLAIAEKALGPEHPNVATSLNNLALLYYTQGKYAQAEPLYRRALAIAEKALGSEHPNVATTLENHADLLQKTNRDAEAANLEARAQAIRAKHAQENLPNLSFPKPRAADQVSGVNSPAPTRRSAWSLEPKSI